MLAERELTEAIMETAIERHRVLGPGPLESADEHCLIHELTQRGLPVRNQVPPPLVYKGLQLECGYRIDLAVEETVVVELKAVGALPPIREAQLITYLKLSRMSVGLLINFCMPLLKDGIVRRVL
jgi:GxxExxY protein